MRSEGEMTPEQAVEALCNAGLVARYDPRRAFGQISALGDPDDSDSEIRCYRWGCWAHRNTQASMTLREQVEHAHRLFDEWSREAAK